MEHNFDKYDITKWTINEWITNNRKISKYYNNEPEIISCKFHSNSPRVVSSLNSAGNYVCIFQWIMNMKWSWNTKIQTTGYKMNEINKWLININQAWYMYTRQ